jgi:hypothetical protein
MMMKMLDAAGFAIVTDAVRAADDDNPKGYFEYERVKELDKPGDKRWVAEHRGKVLKVISFLLQDLPGDCFYRVIFMQRDLEEVLRSQNTMLERRGERADEGSDARMIQLYREHLNKVALMLDQRPNVDVLEVSYGRVVADPRGEAERVARFLGVPDRAERMAGAVDRELYRNRRGS